MSWCYGEIAYAKGWRGFKNAQSKTRAYNEWRRDVKAYIKSHSFDPRRLTDDQSTVILDFASSLPPLKSQIKFVKQNQCADGVRDMSRQLRILVKDTAKKLRTAMEHD